MKKLLTPKEFGENQVPPLTPCRIRVLCHEGRIEGAQWVGTAWVIPEDAEIIYAEHHKGRRKT